MNAPANGMNRRRFLTRLFAETPGDGGLEAQDELRRHTDGVLWAALSVSGAEHYIGGGINEWTTAYGTLFRPHSAGSLHPGGINVVFGDGSVRFVSQNTSHNTLVQLCTMYDGQVISDLP